MSNFTFDFTAGQLRQILKGNQFVYEWYAALYAILPEYEIHTPRRVAAFVAQCAHESMNFRVLKENLNYQAATLTRIWPTLFPPDVAQRYASSPNKQQMIANRAYGNRMGNGPEASGDGWKFCGRGLIQLTGRNNYEAFADSIETPVEEIPDYLMTYEGAVQSACWFWESNNLNRWADAGDIVTLTKRINGGVIGLADRQSHYNHALHIFEG